MRVAQLKANSSNNTIFADDKGEIAYLHPQFVPRRSERFDYTKPVDGSDPGSDWGSLHSLPELPNSIMPPTGLGPEHECVAVPGGRRVQPGPTAFSKVHGHVRRELSRTPRGASC